MKILLLHSGGNEAAADAGKIVSELSLSFVSENVSSACYADLMNRIKSVSHIITCVGQKDTDAPGVYLCAGFALGRGRAEYCCFYGETAEGLEEEYPVCSGLEDLRKYLEEEMRFEKRNAEAVEARERIISAGYAYTEEGLVRSVLDGDLQSVSMFLLAGFSADTAGEKGIPLLSLAIREGKRETAKLLIEEGANIDVPAPDNGNTPLMEATVQGDEELVRMLLRKGCRLDMQNKSGQTALVLAVGAGYEKIVQFLVEAGADRNVVDALGMTAKKYAELFKNRKILNLLA